MKTKSPISLNYNRENLTAGILHFGVGNFHRAHLEYYTHQLLADESQSHWGICGAMIMPQDKGLYEALKGQGNMYSLTICGRDGQNQVEWMGGLVELLFQGDDSEAILNKVADKSIRIITMTITEGGYNLDTEQVRHDLSQPATPQSVFGIIAEGLRRRVAAGAGPLTILTCDNLQHNGNVCKRVVTDFITQQDPELAAWLAQNVTFPNCMVDRITPATTPADRERINATLPTPDAAPVYCEDYIQWVVEDCFAAGRPAWEKVGVEFTDDVNPYEKMKLRLLNASHSLLSYPAILSGYRKVDEAMKDENIVKFVRSFMDKDVTPHVPAPKGIDLEVYRQTLIERFGNSAVSDQVSRLCGDGASKFPVYVMPIIADLFAHDEDVTRVAYLVAAYRHYLALQKDDAGEGYDIFEPAMTAADWKLIESGEALDFLSASAFSSVDLVASPAFVQAYEQFVADIATKGTMSTLKSIL
ncbi:MAG: mannitol dehydrogenase family protein [Akkermansia sp.]